ncbi:endopeptidase La [Candidatus Berkiella cookevillensis]|uniref:Lon protease n=1 Tax=Candidatus Berkiella cookevillensis TaxID=437022 RepID=A0A0Q9YFJ0_9GAMM|nr:endopeptidase La [Candidatus Berkiella cookevillensis]MCS5708900.1 endopeptidase La [Candidatus Berkiella cookevillensis]
MDVESKSDEKGEMIEIPVLPLRDVVVYPHMVIPLFVGREKSIKALDAAMAAGEKQILLVAQNEATKDNPTEKDVFQVGAISTILQLLKLPDGTVKVLVEGIKRGKIESFVSNDPYFLAQTEVLEEHPISEGESEVLIRTLMGQFEKYVKLNKKIPPEIVTSVASIDDLGRLSDTIAAHISLKIQDKQSVLEMSNLRLRVEKLMALMESEIDMLQVEHRIRSNVKRQMEKSQREYYLNEQMKAIQEELGHQADEYEELKNKIEKAGMSQEALEKVNNELNKLKMMAPMSAEATVCRNYIDWMLQVPWKKKSKLKLDLPEAEAILDSDHYGLEKVKERIIEFLAVQKRVKKLKGPILCLVGPPGVGKTSLGRSIARATQRNYIRMSLGGVRDEAEIRGHRKTYVGAMPGKILQKLAKVGVRNPLFLLDEVDKMAMDFRGDPASALLEVLDPEQNNSFNDHYLEVDYDLSDIMFVATANSLNIPAPLLDRMEVIRLSGYTEDEKLNIAIKYLIPKQMKNNGLQEGELKVSEKAVLAMIRYYTREAGVRSLEREVAKLARKVVKEILMDDTIKTVSVEDSTLEKYLGVQRYRFGVAEEQDRIGQVTGLAWTEVGGDILTIEAMAVPGKGKTTSTGKLGEVMQESIQAALSVVRSRTKMLGIPSDFYEKKDIHIHVPEGATPKDGPSAGIGMCTALVSVLTNIAVRADVAMTGEITLRGEVLPIGGLKEKLLAARRAGIKVVIIPEENKRDLKEIPENIIKDLKIHCVKWIDEVLEIALTQLPQPLKEEEVNAEAVKKKNADSEPTDVQSH